MHAYFRTWPWHLCSCMPLSQKVRFHSFIIINFFHFWISWGFRNIPNINCSIKTSNESKYLIILFNFGNVSTRTSAALVVSTPAFNVRYHGFKSREVLAIGVTTGVPLPNNDWLVSEKSHWRWETRKKDQFDCFFAIIFQPIIQNYTIVVYIQK